MLGRGTYFGKKVDSKNYNGFKPTKIKNREGEEKFYGYGYTGEYLNNGQPMDFGPELQPNNLGYRRYVGERYQPIGYGPKSSAEWDYATTDPFFMYEKHGYKTLVRNHADTFFTDLRPPPPPPEEPRPPKRGKIPLCYVFRSTYEWGLF
ncbi:hypothetical protein MKW94_006925 [Papaver nudicaule]|uniref:Uncharacterized protein n=1 Tax=Papaver nudicaule TaxID=74823 RepID=A0AA41VYJ0_PAPNU|nr:hypothetical protein [Papaver nudicaule]